MAIKTSHSWIIQKSPNILFLGLDYSKITEPNLWMKTFQPEPAATLLESNFQTINRKAKNVPMTTNTEEFKINKQYSFHRLSASAAQWMFIGNDIYVGQQITESSPFSRNCKWNVENKSDIHKNLNRESKEVRVFLHYALLTDMAEMIRHNMSSKKTSNSKRQTASETLINTVLIKICKYIHTFYSSLSPANYHNKPRKFV